jgi:micrococcal nuclease
LSPELVKAGMAWRFKAYSSDPALIEAQDPAWKLKRGLWVQPDPQPHWEYRKSHRRQDLRPDL